MNLRLSKLPSTKVLLKLEFDTEDQVLFLTRTKSTENGNILPILPLFWDKKDHSRDNTFHYTLELINIFLESMEPGKWE